MPKNTKRLNLELDSETYRRLLAIQKAMHAASATETLRRLIHAEFEARTGGTARPGSR